MLANPPVSKPPMRSIARSLVVVSMLVGCGGGGASPSAAPRASEVLDRAAYTVHEWGLVHGGPGDTIALSGSVPGADEPIAVDKPVVYFHLDGAASLEVRVEARMGSGGVITESWPLAAEASATSAVWAARLTHGSCSHARLPSRYEAPCSFLVEGGCESMTLGSVESADADCVEVAGQRANHLFYRGGLRGVDPLPLRVQRLPDGRLRVHHRGTEPLPGRLYRVRFANGVSGQSDAASSSAPPTPGGDVLLDVPTGAIAAAATQSAADLGAQGLSQGEVRAFRNAWDPVIFHLSPEDVDRRGVDIPPRGPEPLHGAVDVLNSDETTRADDMPARPPAAAESLVYFLAAEGAEQLSTLSLTPPPREVRRVMAVWLELPAP